MNGPFCTNWYAHVTVLSIAPIRVLAVTSISQLTFLPAAPTFEALHQVDAEADHCWLARPCHVRRVCPLALAVASWCRSHLLDSVGVQWSTVRLEKIMMIIMIKPGQVECGSEVSATTGAGGELASYDMHENMQPSLFLGNWTINLLTYAPL